MHLPRPRLDLDPPRRRRAAQHLSRVDVAGSVRAPARRRSPGARARACGAAPRRRGRGDRAPCERCRVAVDVVEVLPGHGERLQRLVVDDGPRSTPARRPRRVSACSSRLARSFVRAMTSLGTGTLHGQRAQEELATSAVPGGPPPAAGSRPATTIWAAAVASMIPRRWYGIVGRYAGGEVVAERRAEPEPAVGARAAPMLTAASTRPPRTPRAAKRPPRVDPRRTSISRAPASTATRADGALLRPAQAGLRLTSQSSDAMPAPAITAAGTGPSSAIASTERTPCSRRRRRPIRTASSSPRTTNTASTTTSQSGCQCDGSQMAISSTNSATTTSDRQGHGPEVADPALLGAWRRRPAGGDQRC